MYAIERTNISLFSNKQPSHELGSNDRQLRHTVKSHFKWNFYAIFCCTENKHPNGVRSISEIDPPYRV